MIKKHKLRTWLTYEQGAQSFSNTIGVSLTVPDMSMTIREILTKHHRELPPLQTMPVYNSLDVPNLRTLDLVDVADYRKSLKDKVFDLRDLLKKQRADAAQAPITDKRAKAKAAAELAKRALVLKEAAAAGIDVNSLKE